MVSKDNDYYDAIVDDIENDYIREINYINEEFKEWLKENSLFLEALPQQNPNQQQASNNNSSQGFEQWKVDTINGLQKNYSNFDAHIRSQVAQDANWFKQFNYILDNPKAFPVSPKLNLKKAPAYVIAVQRLSLNLGSKFVGIDMNKVEPNHDENSNLWLKHFLIPDYNGGDYTKFCLDYFSGEDKKLDYSSEDMHSLIPLAYKFCYEFLNKSSSAKNDLTQFLRFINQNVDGNTQSPVQQSNVDNIQQRQNMKKAAGAASTSPQANVGMNRPVNADTNFTLFMGEYFGDILNEEEIQRVNSMVANQNKNQQTAAQSPKPTDKGSLILRKRAAIDIVKICFNAKITAMGKLYRDFIYILRNHVASHKGARAGAAGQDPTYSYSNENPNQQQPKQ